MASAVGGERELLSWLDRLDSEMKAYRAQTGFERNCEMWLKWRNGEMQGGPQGEPVFAANLLGAYIDKKVAQLTQSKPDIRVIARNPDLAPSAHVLTDVAKAVLGDQQFDAKIETAADLAATFGFVGFRTVWDPNGDYGAGTIRIEVLDPRRLYIDHHVKDVTEIQKAQYIRIDTPLPLDDVKRIWGERAESVSADAQLSGFKEASMGGSGSWWGSAMKRTLRPFSNSTGPYEWVMVSEYWLRSTQTDKTGAPQFPNGRRLVRAGRAILEDGPNPYWDGLWDVDIWDWRVNGDSYMGRSDVEEGRKLQETLNRVGDAVTRNMILSAVMTVIADYNALQPTDWAKLDNRAARIIKKMPGREVTFVPPPPIPPEYLNFVQMAGSLMETLLGMPPSMQGKRQPGVVANSAIEGLMTQAEVPIRATARRLEYLVERIGHKLVSRIIQFFTSDRIIADVGADGDAQHYVFQRAQLIGNYLEPEAGQPEPTDEERDAKIESFFTEFRFKVIPLSALPSNKVQRGLMAMQLLQAGLIDEAEAFRVMEWPEWKAVLKRVTEQRQQADALAKQENLPLAMLGIDPQAVKAQKPGSAKPPRAVRNGTSLKPG